MIVKSVDLFKKDCSALIGQSKFVLLTSSSSFDRDGDPLYLFLKKRFPDQFRALFALQHGFMFDSQDNMRYSRSFFWEELQLPIINLYQRKLLDFDDFLPETDLFIADLVDVGCRVYTYLNHLVLIMRKLNGSGKKLIILDRPNPLNGLVVEGSLLQVDYISFVGQIPVPMRHGLTAGEYLRFAKDYYRLDLEFQVILFQNWKRSEYFFEPTFFPSPNMGTPEAALLYPGAVLLEGTNISEGRGTIKPFEIFGAPYIRSFELLTVLRRRLNCFSEIYLTPIFFKPEFSKYQGEVCQGIKINLKKLVVENSFMIFYEIIRTISELYPEKFCFTSPPYEFETKRLPIDMISGGNKLREFVQAGKDWLEFQHSLQGELKNYSEQIGSYFLYS